MEKDRSSEVEGLLGCEVHNAAGSAGRGMVCGGYHLL
jgi:hypothetical protein